MSFKCDFLAFSGAVPLFGQLLGSQQLIRARDMFLPRSSVSAACRSLHHLDAVLVIEIEDEEVGEEKCGLRGGVRQLSYASRCKQGRRPTLSVRQPAARVSLSTPPQSFPPPRLPLHSKRRSSHHPSDRRLPPCQVNPPKVALKTRLLCCYRW